MLPPVDPAVLSANPQFEALYTDLCTKKLDTDGTSRLEGKAVKEREAFSEELTKARIESAKRDLLRNALQDLAYRKEELPDEIRELVAVVAAAQGGEIAEEDAEIVEEVMERYKDKASLSSLATAPSKDDTDDLAALISTRQSETFDAQQQIAISRRALTGSISSFHILSRQVLETCIRLLEQTIHGSLARNSKARAEYLATVAEGMAKKLSVQHQQLLQQANSVEMKEVLSSKATEMEREHIDIRVQIREAEEQLEKYNQMRGLEGLAEEYAQILVDVERTKNEIERLEHS
nr:uncharacterized protein CFP56_00226 [Quercus suber]